MKVCMVVSILTEFRCNMCSIMIRVVKGYLELLEKGYV